MKKHYSLKNVIIKTRDIRKMSTRIFFLWCMLFSFVIASGQKIVNVDNNNSTNSNIYGSYFVSGGVPFSGAKYVKVASGSPYFNEEWMKANLVLPKGKTCSGISIRLDLVDNGIEYLDSLGLRMISTTPVIYIEMLDSSNGVTSRFVHSTAMPESTIKLLPGWYRKLSENPNISLYKYMTRLVSERLGYGESTYEQHISEMNDYFVLQKSGMEKVRKLKDLSELFSDKKNLLNTYIFKEKLTGKSDSDYIKLIDYYLSIK